LWLQFQIVFQSFIIRRSTPFQILLILWLTNIVYKVVQIMNFNYSILYLALKICLMNNGDKIIINTYEVVSNLILQNMRIYYSWGEEWITYDKKCKNSELMLEECHGYLDIYDNVLICFRHLYSFQPSCLSCLNWAAWIPSVQSLCRASYITLYPSYTTQFPAVYY